MIIRILLLVGLIRLLIITEKPLVCAGIYTGVMFIFALLLGSPFLTIITGSAIAFGLALLYFWLLNRFRDTGVFWVILILGLVIGLV